MTMLNFNLVLNTTLPGAADNNASLGNNNKH